MPPALGHGFVFREAPHLSNTMALSKTLLLSVRDARCHLGHLQALQAWAIFICSSRAQMWLSGWVVCQNAFCSSLSPICTPRKMLPKHRVHSAPHTTQNHPVAMPPLNVLVPWPLHGHHILS